MDAKSLALIALGQALRAKGYRFVAITPETHRRVVNRKVETVTLESIFGWNLPFDPQALDPEFFALLVKADALEIQEGRVKSSVRFATIADLLFVHSGFPTAERDAVFFGPDTYRFIRALRASCAGVTASRPGPLRLIDIGCGTGAGGIFAARFLDTPPELILADINWKALTFSAINAVINDFPSAKTVFSDVLEGIEGDADIIIANPPYLVDEDQRLYRDGGWPLGISLAVRIADQSLARLKRGGRLVLYSGVPIVRGADPLFESLRPHLQLYGCRHSYEEIDPDVFGEELDKSAYATADRIAAVVLIAIKG